MWKSIILDLNQNSVNNPVPVTCTCDMRPCDMRPCDMPVTCVPVKPGHLNISWARALKL